MDAVGFDLGTETLSTLREEVCESLPNPLPNILVLYSITLSFVSGSGQTMYVRQAGGQDMIRSIRSALSSQEKENRT